MTRHDHGARGVFVEGCDECLVIDLAGCPDVRVKATMREIKATRGRETMLRLSAAIKRWREQHAAVQRTLG